MAVFLKSELVRNFLGGFVFGAILIFTFDVGGDAAAGQGERPVAEAAQTS